MLRSAPCRSITLADHAKCLEIWSKVDFNGNGIVSVAEMDKFITETPADDAFWSPVCDAETGKPKQPVLIRAWKKATSRTYATHTDSFIHKYEFRVFVRCIKLYNELFTVFDELNGDDRRISKDEFIAGVAKLGAEDSIDVGKTFDNIDTNKGGQILFDEFCHFCLTVMDC